MKSLLPVLGILAVASLTPGPNNVLVMRAAHGGWRAVAGVIAGVLAGSLVLLIIVAAGAGSLLARTPALAATLPVAGGLWLAWMGLRIAWPRKPALQPPAAPASASLAAVALFQLSNPKAWLLVTSAFALLPEGAGVLSLASLLVPVSAASLVLWSMAGAAVDHRLRSPTARRTFDGAMGIALTVSALGGIAHVVH